MAPAACRLAVLCIAWACVAWADELPVVGAAWEEDDACPAGSSPEACSLSLRQLRARGAAAAAPAAPHDLAPVPTTPGRTGSPEAPEEYAAADNASVFGVPGGWGEAADWIADFVPDSKLKPQGLWGSCAQYGCISYYNRHHGCQCNHDCQRYGNCCGDYWSRCRRHHHRHPTPAPAPPPPPPPPPMHESDIRTLFHQTSPEACNLILKHNFRPGTRGWCGGGIYFADSVEATNTKAIGPDSHKGCVLKATVNVGKIWQLSPTCNRQLTGSEVWKNGYDSVSFDPGDGQEYIVYSADRVLHIERDR